MTEKHDFETWADVAEKECQNWADLTWQALTDNLSAGSISSCVARNWAYVVHCCDIDTEDADTAEEYTFSGPADEDPWMLQLLADVREVFESFLADLMAKDPEEYGEYVQQFFEDPEKVKQ